MTKEELLRINPFTIRHPLSVEEVMHIFKTLNAFWEFNAEAARAGNSINHALLKSLNHSHRFLNSHEAYKHTVICQLLARQLAKHWTGPRPDWIVPIPNGATKLGEMTAMYMGVRVATMAKEDGKILCLTQFRDGDTLLFVEDFTTKGTGLKEIVKVIREANPGVKLEIIKKLLVVLNRGGLTHIDVTDVKECKIDEYQIDALATFRIEDWPKEDCWICQEFNSGGQELSPAVKPKQTSEMWDEFIHQRDMR